MLPPMFVSEPDTAARSPWISPARPRLQFFRSFALPLCQTAAIHPSAYLGTYCYGTQPRPRTERAPGAHTRSGGWGLPGQEPLSGPDGQWEDPMLRVSCRLAFFLKFPERNPWPSSFFLPLDQFQSR